MQEIEKFLIWFVPLFVLEYLVQGTTSVFLMEAVTDQMKDNPESWSSGSLVYFFTAIKPLLSFATKLLVGIWLYYEAKKFTPKPFYWAFFGAVSGVIVIAIFYLVRIYDYHKTLVNEKII